VHLARLAGVDVRLHWSWAFVFFLVLLGFWGQIESAHPDLGPASVIGLAAGGTVVFFGSVLLHELAHALMARRRGIEVQGITLYVFGGATEADASSRDPGDELVIAAVGPLTSLGLAGALGLAAWLVRPAGEAGSDLLGYLGFINLMLAGFNMVPGLPLDGGRVFRAIAWSATGDFDKATRWATSAGVFVGYFLIGIGLLTTWQGSIGGLWLVGIGWMISQSARANEQQEHLRSTFGQLTAAEVMTTPVVTIAAPVSVAEAVQDFFAHRDQTVFPVLDGAEPIGLLTTAGIRQVPPDQAGRVTVDRVARAHQPAMVAEPSTPMLEVIEALAGQPDGKARVLVMEGGRLVGIISPADIVRRDALRDLLGPRRRVDGPSRSMGTG
jgi:Zn-dependent protease/CBS domain-containing protein